MKRLLLLLLIGVWANQMDAGRPQLPEPFDDPESAWIETEQLFKRMRCMGNQYWVDQSGNLAGINEKIRKKEVAQYIQDIEERLYRLDENRMMGNTTFTADDMANLWALALPYKNYPQNVYYPDDENGANAPPLLPGDDDTPSFSDGQGDEDDDSDDGEDNEEDDTVVHVGQHDQGNNDPFTWDSCD